MTNFSCGEPLKECPWNREIKPPLIEYCAHTTSRSSYLHPLDHPIWVRPPKSYRKGAVEEFAAQGIVPNLLPRIVLKTNKDTFLKNLKAAGPAGYRTVGQCAARTMGKSLKEQALQ
ncbi:Hypothetical predicted protein [Paramuricea clavata]|uniref:Uncharacterized protein n=1 Tax=Paramuricea clavata TaxID=317549 RepID=A0A6S7GG83_PARCT|nr:Hypothetical predicted protein [Paramuricea clavata]